MSRLTQADFKEITIFLKSYSLKQSCENTDFCVLLSCIHKYYYAYLVFLSESLTYGFQNIKTSYSLSNPALLLLENHFKESVSDYGSAFFNWTHGAYKAARLLMRSGIENFVRATCALEDPTICQLTNTHDIFTKAAALTILSTSPKRETLSKIKGFYTTLCADVHTTQSLNMQHISAMDYFPGFILVPGKDTAQIFVKSIGEMVGLSCTLFKDDVYFRMYHLNNDIVTAVIPRHIRTLLNNP